MTDEFKLYLVRIIRDYEMIVAKFAVVGSSLKDLIQLVSFFNNVLTESITEDSIEYKNAKKTRKKYGSA